jgi:GNAT superfamily N-acetyltransferase
MAPMATELSIVPANQASWEDLLAIFGMRGYPSTCLCQRFKAGPAGWTPMPVYERAFRLRVESNCGEPESPTTSGLVAYLDEEPVGWVAVEPRTAYPRLPTQRTVFTQRGEDRADESVWAVTCFVIRAGFRRRGITYALASAAVEHARERGARAVEAYPMITHPGEEITWGETHVGTRNVFAAAGLVEVNHPTKRRLVMRIDFQDKRK